MRPRTPRVCAAVALVTAGCAYDWSVPVSGLDASAPLDATVPVDSAGPGVDASDGAPADAGADVATDSPSCATLLANADSDYAQAIVCAVIGPCTTAHDQCGCLRAVASPSSAATTAYLQAVAAVVDAGCAAACGTCLDAGSPNCVDTANAEGGVTMACY